MFTLQDQLIRQALEGTGIVITRPRTGKVYKARLVGNHYEVNLKKQLRRQFGQRIAFKFSGTEPDPNDKRKARAVWVAFTFI